jgi:hypothetical protein
VLVALDQDGKLLATRGRTYLTSAEATQVLRRCRQAHLQRGGYAIGPALDHLRLDIRHPAALPTASQAIADAWPRQTEGLPVNPAEMLRAIRRLAQAIDALLLRSENESARPREDLVHLVLGDVSWGFAAGADEERFGVMMRELLMAAGAMPDHTWRDGDLLAIDTGGHDGSGKADLVLPRPLALAATRLWRHMDRCVKTVGSTAYVRGQQEAANKAGGP